MRCACAALGRRGRAGWGAKTAGEGGAADVRSHSLLGSVVPPSSSFSDGGVGPGLHPSHRPALPPHLRPRYSQADCAGDRLTLLGRLPRPYEGPEAREPWRRQPGSTRAGRTVPDRPARSASPPSAPPARLRHQLPPTTSLPDSSVPSPPHPWDRRPGLPAGPSRSKQMRDCWREFG